MRGTLLLFTGSWPYAAAAENTFLPQEVAVLAQTFERVILVPTYTGGARAGLCEPNVTVDESFARYRTAMWRRSGHSVAGLGDARFWREVTPRLAMFARRPRGLVRTIRAQVDARMARRWIARQRLDWRDTVLCTWWFEGTTLGLAEFGSLVGMPVVSRAHGRDVYEWRHRPPHIAFREAQLEAVRAVYSVSEAGARYFAERYPRHAGKVQVARLGIDDPGVESRPSADGVFRIVSCSLILKVKRLDLMAAGIAAAGRALPGQRIEWTHVGDGNRAGLEATTRPIMPANVTCQFVAYPGLRGLYERYAATPMDVFMNTSESEGVSVSIMEAIAVGVPVIATSVGGNPEIVGPDNGVLVPANATPGQIGAAIASLTQNRERRTAMRAASRAKWREQYDAATNYPKFAEILRGL